MAGTAKVVDAAVDFDSVAVCGHSRSYRDSNLLVLYEQQEFECVPLH